MSHQHLYNTSRWKARRARQLADQPLCRLCADVFGKFTAASVADHLVPHRGDEEKFFHGELQSLCTPCHSSVKQQIERTGHFSGSCIHGLPLDPLHPWNAEGTCQPCSKKRLEMAGGTLEG